jgi:D-glycero-D-manno-heptose 1,7-bisphosphate phosphatase
MKTLRRAVFLDRDGTVNVDFDYVHRAEQFEFIPGAAEAIRMLREAGFVVIVVTNQSGIGRGYYDEAAVETLHRYMDAELAKAGTTVDGYYFCPHHPHKGIGKYLMECDCRKPLPGRLLRAADEFSIDLSRSYLVGDKLSDVEAALKAGSTPLLVTTGHGEKHAPDVPPGTRVLPDLMAAAREIIAAADDR